MLQLQGAGLAEGDAIDQAIDGFLLRSPNPSPTAVSDFLKLYDASTRTEIGQRLVARGVAASSVSAALGWLDKADTWSLPTSKLWGIASIASSAASAYHGYKRNNSIGWAIWWGLIGGVFPVITPVIAVAQGFGQRKAA